MTDLPDLGAGDPFEVQQLLLTAWQNTTDQAVVRAFFDGIRIAQTSGLRTEDHAVQAQGLQTLPTTVREGWRPITIRLSGLSDTGVPTYGSGATFGSGLIYGQPQAGRYTWAVDSSLVGFDLLVDRIYRPTVVFDGTQVSLDTTLHTLTFVQSPFQLLTGQTVSNDLEITLWARNPRVDRRAAYWRFGAQLNMEGTSGAPYNDSLRALTRGLQQTLTAATLQAGCLAAAGLPVPVGGETVERIDSTTREVTVTTTARCYRLPASSVVTVSVGQAISAGQALCDTLRVYEAGQGPIPVPGILLGPDDLPGMALGFPNENQVWTIRTTAGQPDLRFQAVGTSADQAAFWSAVHSRGLSSTLLATLMGITTPSAVRSVNPQEFILSEVVGPNLVVISVHPERFGVPVLAFYRALLPLLPPWVRHIFHQAIPTQPVQVFDLSVNTTDTASVYPAAVPTRSLISVVGGGGDLDLLEYTPNVMAS